MSDYNGWTNRETWLVNVWYEPESTEDVDYLEDTLEDEFYTLLGSNAGFYVDMIDFHCINWNELRSHFDDDE